MGQDHGDIGVILAVKIFIPHPAVQVHMKGKAQLTVPEGGEPLPKHPLPHIITPVLAHNASPVKLLQIPLLYGKGSINANRLPFLIKVLFLDLIASAHSAYRVQHRGLSCIIFTYQNQRPVNITDLQVADGFKVAYV